MLSRFKKRKCFHCVFIILYIVGILMTVEVGRRFFPNCSEVLDNFLDDDMPDAFFLEKGTTEERRIKKMRFMELKEEVMKAFDKDQAQNNRTGLSSSSSSSSSPKGILNQKVRKR